MVTLQMPWKQMRARRLFRLGLLLAFVIVAATFFAQVEIQIEGTQGWAAGMPTWRIEKHWLLDLFWGGRPMTGYHAWCFSFIALIFHAAVFISGRWTWRLEGRILGCVMIFWIIEDFLWFVLNPAWTLTRFDAAHIPWHKFWFCGVVPNDYVTFTTVGTILLLWSYRLIPRLVRRRAVTDG